MTRMTTAAAACLSLTLACTGQIGAPSPTNSTGASNGGPPVGSDGVSTVNSPVTCSGRATDIDLTPLRRLTNAEYLNTVSDLLGDISGLNLDFAADLTTADYPFRNKAAEQQTPPVLTYQYLTAAEKIAADVVKNRLARVLTCDP